ncbi:uncharacterized protein BDW43DRAFT_286350 [Aspergillus alliaceus]|uniref:uncharacterized protein n=1 Tax=Petromyces alliaceus TaxID=209559 RepID=UPI0012A58F94|nr:uncharacterized protein BDW43DRAFT_286350 [Aspergillus alliaceus]KAB8230166.1 hypothetical protein BDW43DRAFT_286350 [Aspergillus alliaceus]
MLTLNQSQFTYSNLVICSGCAGDANTFACLRGLDTESLLRENISTPSLTRKRHRFTYTDQSLMMISFLIIRTVCSARAGLSRPLLFLATTRTKALHFIPKFPVLGNGYVRPEPIPRFQVRTAC